MSQMPNNPLGPMPSGQPPRRANPDRLATVVGSYVSAFVRLVFWTVVCAAGLLAIRLIVWAFRVISTAVGV